MGVSFLGRLGDYSSALAGAKDFAAWSNTLSQSSGQMSLITPDFLPDIGFISGQTGHLVNSSAASFVFYCMPFAVGGIPGEFEINVGTSSGYATRIHITIEASGVIRGQILGAGGVSAYFTVVVIQY